MASNRVLLMVLASALAFGVACGDDDDTPPPPTDSGPRDSGPPPPTDSGPDDDAGTPDDAGGLPCDSAGACCNASDLAAVSAETYGAMMDQSYNDIASTCGQGCALDADPATCTTNCLDTMTMSAAADACETCFVATVLCAINNCVAPCLTDPSSMACTDCRCGMNTAMANCVGDWVTCTGIPTDTCASM